MPGPREATIRDLLFVVTVGKRFPPRLGLAERRDPGDRGALVRSLQAPAPGQAVASARLGPRGPSRMGAERQEVVRRARGRAAPAAGRSKRWGKCALSAPRARDAAPARPCASSPSRPPRASTSGLRPHPRGPAAASRRSAPRVPEPPARRSVRRRPTFVRRR